jgi:subtilisin-like proprotein convertase family protein
MLRASFVVGIVLGAFACEGSDPGSNADAGMVGGGDAGMVGGGDAGVVVPACPDTSTLHSEGSASEPVSFPLASEPITRQVRPSEGPSYYRVTGLQIGSRYKVQFTGSLWGSFALFQSGFSGTALCDKETLVQNQVTCYVVAQKETADIRVSAVMGSAPACFGLDVTKDSPAGAFEGAPDAELALRFGTSDLPHRGIVDHYRSFYRITQLTPGKRYTVWMTGLEDSVDLFAGNLVVQEDRVNQACVRSSSGINLEDEWCTFVAGRDYVDVEVTDYYGGTTSSKFVLSAFEDFDSEGSAAAPVVLAYAGGLTHPGHVGPQASASDPPAKSYYQVTGLTPSAKYLIALIDFGGRPWLYSDAAFSTAISCANPSQLNSCEFAAPGSSIYVAVPSWFERSQQFTLHVSAATVNQGSSTQPMALSYSAFSYSGQARTYSDYLVSSVPSGPLKVTLSPLDAPLGLAAWSATASGISCMRDGRFPRCTVAASAAGELRVRVEDAGRFTLDLRPAPDLKSQYGRVSGVLAIPDSNATGLSETLTVSGSAITAISRVTVEVYVRHGQPQELTFVLVSPGGTEVQLVKESASASPTVDPHEGVTYDDFALAREAGFLGAASFVRRPRRPLHLLTGENANGTWTLRVIDTLAANIQDDTGELLGWGLSFY